MQQVDPAQSVVCGVGATGRWGVAVRVGESFEAVEGREPGQGDQEDAEVEQGRGAHDVSEGLTEGLVALGELGQQVQEDVGNREAAGEGARRRLGHQGQPPDPGSSQVQPGQHKGQRQRAEHTLPERETNVPSCVHQCRPCRLATGMRRGRGKRWRSGRRDRSSGPGRRRRCRRARRAAHGAGRCSRRPAGHGLRE